MIGKGSQPGSRAFFNPIEKAKTTAGAIVLTWQQWYWVQNIGHLFV